MTLPPIQDMPPGRQEARRLHLMQEVRTRPRRMRRRVAIGGLTTSALVAGLATALVVAPTADVGGNPPAAQADAATVLLRAATVAASQPDLSPRPNQFIYVESKSFQAAWTMGDSPKQPEIRTHRRVWLSVNGRQAGLIKGIAPDNGVAWACDDQDGVTAEPKSLKVDIDNPPKGCHNTPAIRPDLPTEPKAMLKWLYRNSAGGNPPDVQAFVTVGDTIRETYIKPAALAAMFKAAAKIPGATVTKNAVDMFGRKGIAVGQTWHGTRHELIFDAKTYQLIGERQVADYDNSFRPSGGSTPDTKPWTPDPKWKRPPQGKVLYTTATIRIAVTDRAGQTPR